jgi:hypothetical protein
MWAEVGLDDLDDAEIEFAGRWTARATGGRRRRTGRRVRCRFPGNWRSCLSGTSSALEIADLTRSCLRRGVAVRLVNGTSRERYGLRRSRRRRPAVFRRSPCCMNTTRTASRSRSRAARFPPCTRSATPSLPAHSSPERASTRSRSCSATGTRPSRGPCTCATCRALDLLGPRELRPRVIERLVLDGPDAPRGGGIRHLHALLAELGSRNVAADSRSAPGACSCDCSHPSLEKGISVMSIFDPTIHDVGAARRSEPPTPLTMRDEPNV